MEEYKRKITPNINHNNLMFSACITDALYINWLDNLTFDIRKRIVMKAGQNETSS